jgi:hypothetical protein
LPAERPRAIAGAINLPINGTVNIDPWLIGGGVT